MIRVLIVDENALVPDVLRQEPDFQIVGVASCGAQAVRLAVDADIALVNLQPRQSWAMDVVVRLGAMPAEPRIVMTGVRCPEEELPPFLDQGIAGYTLLDCNAEEFVETLRVVQRGEAILSPKLAAAVMHRLVLLSRARERAALTDPIVTAVRTLTVREGEVIELVGRGLSNQEIADYLNIEVGTVKNHVHHVLRKLDVDSRRAAAAMVANARSLQANHLLPAAGGPLEETGRHWLYGRRLPA